MPTCIPSRQLSLGTRFIRYSSLEARKVLSSTGTSHLRQSPPPPKRSPSNLDLGRRSRKRTTPTSGRSPSIRSATSSSVHPTTTPRTSGVASGLGTSPSSLGEAGSLQRSWTHWGKTRRRRRWCLGLAWRRKGMVGGEVRKKTGAMGRQLRGHLAPASYYSVVSWARWTRVMT